MIGPIATKRARHLAQFWSGEQGLTLIELLLSLALLALVASFTIGGLSMGRRAFDADHARANDANIEAAIHTLLSVVASAVPYPMDEQNSIAFEGSAESIRFVALSEGRALRGGIYKVELRRVGREIVLEIVGRPGARKQDKPPISTVVVLGGVHAVHFEYFGATGQPVWQKEWHSQALPSLVSVRVDFEDGRSSGPAAMVALRQG